MARYKLVVMSKPAIGRESEYNDWYQNIHLPQLLAIDGVHSAQRLRLTESLTPGFSSPYLAIYEIETDNPKRVIDEIKDKAEMGTLMISDALNPDVSAVLYEEFD
jgi:hypothetical protein